MKPGAFSISFYRSIALVSLLLILSCTKRKEEPSAPVVNTVRAVARDVPLYVDTFGNCITIASVTVQAQVTGILSQTLFKEGEIVQPGQRLFTIDPAPYQAAFQRAQGDLEAARANLWNSQQSLQRQTQLYAKQTIDVQTLENAQAAEQSSQGKLQSAEAALRQASINLSYCSIESPISGKTGVYLVNTGNLVAANTTQLVNIQTIHPIYVDFTVSENELENIRKYFDRHELEVIVTVPGRGNYKAKGRLQFINNNVSAQSGTLQLRAQFENADSVLWPGLFVNVRLILHVLSSAVLVPHSAILVGQKGPFLFVLDETGHARLRTVQPGGLHGDLIVIQEGVKEGEAVVTSGQLMLSDGGLAKVRSAATHPATEGLSTPTPHLSAVRK